MVDKQVKDGGQKKKVWKSRDWGLVTPVRSEPPVKPGSADYQIQHVEKYSW
jgi:hypothetical protein